MGERTPHLDASARGGWVGITAKHTRADLIRAVIEGVSYSQKDCLELIEGMGVKVESVRASGGGAQSPFWRQMLADVFGKRVVVLKTQEGSAYGAALLAMTGTGEYASVPGGVQGRRQGSQLGRAERARTPSSTAAATKSTRRSTRRCAPSTASSKASDSD